MTKSWINPRNPKQEQWAAKYLIKKQQGLTRSVVGQAAARQWQVGPALDFLLGLERGAKSEASDALLKIMQDAWTQQELGGKKKKSIQVHISLSSSKQLNSLAKAVGITRGRAMETLIANNYEALVKSVDIQKDTDRRNREMIAHLQLENDDLRRLLSEAQKELVNQKKAITQLTVRNLELRDKCNTHG